MKVWWGSSVGRGYEPDHVNSIVKMLARSKHHWYWKPIHGDALIERSRSRSATAFLDSDSDVFVSVDTDIVFDYADIDALVDQAVTHSLVVGAYATRSSIKSFVTSALLPHTTVDFEVGVPADESSPIPIQWGATGFMAVHRRVFEKLATGMRLLHRDEPLRHYPFYTPFEHEPVKGYPILLSEDYAFCERARQAGFPPYLNPAIRLGHLGPYCYRLEDMTVVPPQPMDLLLTRTNDGAPAQYLVERPE